MIPKKVHNIWIQGYKNLPSDKKNNLNHIKKLNPNYQFYFWDENKLLNLLSKYPTIKNIYLNLNKIQGFINLNANKSDIGRFIIMKEFGGIYFDLDFQCLKPFQKIINQNYDINIASSYLEVAEFVPYINRPKYCSCFMAFSPKNPIWDIVLQKIEIASTKKQIGEALDRSLQEVKPKLYLLPDKMVKSVYSYEKNPFCFTPTQSSWNNYRPILRYVNYNYSLMFLLFILFIIIIYIFFFFRI